MGQLAIDTPEGKATLLHEARCYEIYEQHYPVTVQRINKVSQLDAFIIKDGEIVGAIEQKSRSMTLRELDKHGSWLISNSKIQAGQTVSRLLRMPFYGFLYLVPDDTLLIWRITNDEGVQLFEYQMKNTRTIATMHGGYKKRINAFLPITEIEDILVYEN